ncbi:pyridoxal-phosphate-dependent aminotransferase family protein [Thalassobaculum litoreum]|uniref:Alanine-glyoxylate transaminase / serine-glyoxylate transaminase / serine-pyruvate transaminase n=1 Tax=Thalassobaculum litoreum DSM 18839 TaxID=1123362 RepID=A0A8G2BI12_9PROT|nr:aminotransferase class V-fold PLP-dependent enzyme [Thalassobaculum litoreum]SDF78807.1 alanine-glyoxylate transaminase / serine-glyoxylate transaminase / serine-pyruvate transaminase [Thalassobaculum litoreum DSM 18839]
MAHRAGPHFLQIPGPSNVPGRILRAIERPTIDHRGPEFQALAKEVLEKIKPIFKTKNPVIIFPASGTGAWEAALVNTLSPGDKVLMVETGQFSTLWVELATRIGLKPEVIEGDWRHGVDPAEVEARLSKDKGHEIKAVCCVHNETSTGVTSRIPEVRKAIDAAGHPALFMVDTISGLASADLRHDEWGIDVTISGSQKGLMLPPGISFNAVSDKALEAAKSSKMTKSYWEWSSQIGQNPTGNFPYTPNTNLLYGLNEACDMLMDEGLENVFARHERHAEATRRAVRQWGLEIQCEDTREYSPVLTGVVMPEGHDADAVRKVILDKFDMSLGAGLGKVKGRMFRIGHLGDFNDLMLCGTLSGCEMGLRMAGVPIQTGGVQAALDYLSGNA